jgi:trimeric autotransporter adhesin
MRFFTFIAVVLYTASTLSAQIPTGWLGNNRLLFPSPINANVGIGTPTPTRPLEVTGTANGAVMSANNSNAASTAIAITGTTVAGTAIKADGGTGTAIHANAPAGTALLTTGRIRFQNLIQQNTFTQILASDASGNIAWRDASTLGGSGGGTAGWGLLGNAVTTAGQFLGPTTLMPLEFKINNFRAGWIEPAGNGNNANTFLGYMTGLVNSTGSYNTAVGVQTAYNNISGVNNSFFGALAGLSNTTGRDNTFLGLSAGKSNTDGKNNCFVGFEAGVSNASGNTNTFMGYQAGQNNNGIGSNTFMGGFSGRDNTTGWGNVFLGNQSGVNSVTGSQNVCIGTASNFNTASGGTGDANVAVGFSTNLIGSNNTVLGSYSAIASITSGITNATAIGYSAKVSRNNAMVLGDPTVAAYTVAIGTANPSSGYKLHIVGDALATGGLWTSSDSRFKKNIETIKKASEIVQHLEGKTYEMNTKAFPDRNFDEGKTYGFIAQELAKVVPEAVRMNDDGFYAVKYETIIPILVEAVKEQKATIDTQNAKIEEQSKRLSRLEQLLLKDNSATLTSTPSVSNVKLTSNPNPVSGEVTISYEMPQLVKNARLTLCNAAGDEVKSIELTNCCGNVTLDVQGLPNGMFFLKLTSENKFLATHKMVIAH